MEKNLTPLLLPQISNPASPSSFSVDDPVSHFIKKTEATRREVSQAPAMSTQPCTCTHQCLLPSWCSGCPIHPTEGHPRICVLDLLPSHGAPTLLPPLSRSSILPWNIPTSKAHDLLSPPSQNSWHSSRHPLAQCREAEGGRGRRQQRMWWGLRQPGQHVQRSRGRKEHAARRPRWQVHREAGWEVRPGRGQSQALLKVLSFALQALGS